MEPYLSSHTNGIDAKGRVSIPAQFRSILAAEGAAGRLWCTFSLDSEAVDAGGPTLRKIVTERISQIDPLSEDYDLYTVVLADSVELNIDKEGRVMLPDSVRNFTGITDRVTFVGRGFKFQLWNPDVYDRVRLEMREKLRARRRSVTQAEPQ